MKDRNQIDKKIRESFNYPERSVPPNVWDGIEDELGKTPESSDPIDEAVRESYNQTGSEAPAHVWENINHRLNLDSVWYRISESLTRLEKIDLWKKIGTAALFTMILGTVIYLSFKEFAQDNFQASEEDAVRIKEPAVQNNVDSEIGREAYSNDLETKENTEDAPANQMEIDFDGGRDDAPVLSQMSDPLPENTNLVSTENTTNINANLDKTNEDHEVLIRDTPDIFTHESGGSRENITQTSSDLGDSISVRIPDLESNILPTIPGKMKSGTLWEEPEISSLHSIIGNTTGKRLPRPIILGITFSFNNTWLIDNNTRISFDPNSLISSKSSYASSYCTYLDYAFTYRSSLVAEFYISSDIHMHYDQYDNGHYLSKNVELSYYKLGLLYNRRISLGGNRVKITYSYKLGGYVGYLTDHLVQLEDITLSEKEFYFHSDYGLKFATGPEFDFGHIILQAGINAEWGLKNIFQGRGSLSPELNLSRNALVGFHISAGYRIR